VLAGPKKIDILTELTDACSSAGVTLRLHPKPKKDDGSTQIGALLAACRASGEPAVVGTLPRVSPASWGSDEARPLETCCQTIPQLGVRWWRLG
jgi:hypothetical protein